MIKRLYTVKNRKTENCVELKKTSFHEELEKRRNRKQEVTLTSGAPSLLQEETGSERIVPEGNHQRP